MSVDTVLEYYRKKLGISEDEHQKNIEVSKNESKTVQLIEQSKTPDDKYKEIESNPDVTLDKLKQAKIDQLDYLCSQTILKGFQYTVNGVLYHFSLSLVAQSNMQETGDMFNEGVITSENWTALNTSTGKIERVLLDELTFNDVRNAGRKVVRDNVSRFRDVLEPQVHAVTITTTLEDALTEVKAITW